VLEEALADYDGTLVVISHDRYFLDAVCTRILHVAGPAGDGRVEIHAGNYSDWKAREKELARAASEKAREKEKTPAKATARAAAPPPADPDVEKRARIEEREQKKQADRDRQKKERRFAELEKLIADGEGRLETLRAQLAADHAGDWQRLNGLVAEEQQLAAKVGSLYGEWEQLGQELM
jgi:ATP-binding cassette subfamily F protein 3